jgi:MFS transporter, FSR family, fosmidomycin resistance protein
MTDLALARPERDVRIIAVVSAAHFTSHFFMIALPPLFALVRDEWHVSYTELGSVTAVFFIASALGQIISGFAVDRFGPHRVLPVGMAILAASVVMMGFATQFWMLIPLSALGGIGNSVYHPADYSVLSHRISPQRIARGYSTHTVLGTMGWAAPPVTMVFLASHFGWHNALICVGVCGLIAAAAIALDQDDLRLPEHIHKVRANEQGGEHAPRAPSFRVITSLPVLMAFVFFTLLSLALSTVQSFMPTMLPQVQNISLAFASTFTTLYFAINACGSILGGWIIDRYHRIDAIITIGMTLSAILMVVIGYVGMPPIALMAMGAIVGLVVGITMPSRDMLVRQSAPPGATGKVFGFVYSGLDLGALLVPIFIGPMLDHNMPSLPFAFIAITLLLTIVVALIMRRASLARDMKAS